MGEPNRSDETLAPGNRVLGSVPPEGPSQGGAVEPVNVRDSPFKALLASWSLMAAVLGVAGFSLRWSYFYSFGVQNLVLKTPITSLPIYAIEFIRNPENFPNLARLVGIYLIPLQLLTFPE